MPITEFWGWVGYLQLRAATIEEQRKRAVGMLRVFAQKHNNNVKMRG